MSSSYRNLGVKINSKIFLLGESLGQQGLMKKDQHWTEKKPLLNLGLAPREARIQHQCKSFLNFNTVSPSSLIKTKEATTMIKPCNPCQIQN